MSNTTNYNLQKLAYGTYNWDSSNNNNLDIIDSQMKINANNITNNLNSINTINSQLAEVAMITKETIQTTTGQSWSTNKTVEKVKIDGTDNYLMSKPNYARKRIMIFGSSVAYGYGASTTTNGWANLMGIALQTRGYEVINNSIPGNTTSALISRFYTDIAPFNPDIVVIALSLANEGILNTNKDAVYDSFKTGIKTLVKMLRQQSITPVIANCYANGSYTATEYRYVKNMNRELDAWGVPVLNIDAGSDNLSGNWITGMMSDNYHPNDAGHNDMFYCVPLSLFDNLTDLDNKPSVKNGKGYIHLLNTDVTAIPLQLHLDSNVRSFTIGFKVKNIDGNFGKAGCGLGNGTSRVRNLNQVWQYTPNSGAGELVSTVNGYADKMWHHIAIAYHPFVGTVRFYVDGILIGETPDTLDISQGFCLGGRMDGATQYNAAGYAFKDLTINRGRLNDEQIADLANGKIIKSSLELYSPLNENELLQGQSGSYNGQRFINLAPSSSYMYINTPNLQHMSEDLECNNAQVGGNLLQSNTGYSHLGQTKPSSPVEGDHFYSVASHKPVWYNGTAWIDGAGNVVTNP